MSIHVHVHYSRILHLSTASFHLQCVQKSRPTAQRSLLSTLGHAEKMLGSRLPPLVGLLETPIFCTKFYVTLSKGVAERVEKIFKSLEVVLKQAKSFP